MCKVFEELFYALIAVCWEVIKEGFTHHLRLLSVQKTKIFKILNSNISIPSILFEIHTVYRVYI